MLTKLFESLDKFKCIQGYQLGHIDNADLADVLHVLQLPELREGVVPERLVQRRVAVLVRHVQVAPLAHQQTHDLIKGSATPQSTLGSAIPGDVQGELTGINRK